MSYCSPERPVLKNRARPRSFNNFKEFGYLHRTGAEDDVGRVPAKTLGTDCGERLLQQGCVRVFPLASLVVLCFMKLSTHRVDLTRPARGTDGLAMIPGDCKV